MPVYIWKLADLFDAKLICATIYMTCLKLISWSVIHYFLSLFDILSIMMPWSDGVICRLTAHLEHIGQVSPLLSHLFCRWWNCPTAYINLEYKLMILKCFWGHHLCRSSSPVLYFVLPTLPSHVLFFVLSIESPSLVLDNWWNPSTNLYAKYV